MAMTSKKFGLCCLFYEMSSLDTVDSDTAKVRHGETLAKTEILQFARSGGAAWSRLVNPGAGSAPHLLQRACLARLLCLQARLPCPALPTLSPVPAFDVPVSASCSTPSSSSSAVNGAAAAPPAPAPAQIIWASDSHHALSLLHNQFELILNTLKDNTEHSYPFLQRVSKKDAPDYYTIIHNPMDFGTITKKVRSREYKSLLDFEADVRLIYDNCRTYNDEESLFRHHADEMEALTDQLLANFPDMKIIPDHCSTSDPGGLPGNGLANHVPGLITTDLEELKRIHEIQYRESIPFEDHPIITVDESLASRELGRRRHESRHIKETALRSIQSSITTITQTLQIPNVSQEALALLSSVVIKDIQHSLTLLQQSGHPPFQSNGEMHNAHAEKNGFSSNGHRTQSPSFDQFLLEDSLHQPKPVAKRLRSASADVALPIVDNTNGRPKKMQH